MIKRLIGIIQVQFIKSSLWSGLSVAVKTINILIINKVIAFYFNPSGVALYAHFQNFLGLFLSIPSDGLDRGMIKYLADKDISVKDYRKVFFGGIILNLLYYLLAIAGLLLFKDYFIALFALGMNSFLWLSIITISIFLQLFNFFFLNIILAAQKIKTYVALTISSNFLVLIGVCFFAIRSEFNLTLLAIAVGPAILFFVTIFLAVRNRSLKFNLNEIFDDILVYRKLGQFILMGASIMVFGRLVDFVIRQYVIDDYGLEQTGLWQAVVKLSDNYSAAFVAIVGMVYYPRISELIHHKEELKNYIRSVLAISTPVIVIGLAIVYFFKEEFLVLFFQSKFREAAYLVNFQLVGDLFKLVSYFLGYLIVVQVRTSLFIISQGVSAIVSLILIYICSNYWGLEGLPIAHSIRYSLYLLFVVLLYRKTLFS